MLILTVDTSGKRGSIALARCEGRDCAIFDVVPLAGGTFSAQLVPQIAALLSKNSLSKKDIGGFAVASGPGSFTGLRVGLAAVKGLAEVLGKPIAAVSLLEALANAAAVKGEVTVALDAGRNEVYLGTYAVSDQDVHCRDQCILARDEFEHAVAGRTLVTSDEDIARLARSSGARVIEVAPIRSDTIARLGWKKIQSGDTIPADELEANYIRRSDAEIFSKPTA